MPTDPHRLMHSGKHFAATPALITTITRSHHSAIPPDGDRVGRFGHGRDQKSHRQFGPRLRRRSRANAESRRFRHDARRQGVSTVHLADYRGDDQAAVQVDEAFAWDEGEGAAPETGGSM